MILRISLHRSSSIGCQRLRILCKHVVSVTLGLTTVSSLDEGTEGIIDVITQKILIRAASYKKSK